MAEEHMCFSQFELLDEGVNKEILCIPGYRKFHKIVQSNSQTTSRICQLSVDAKKEEGHDKPLRTFRGGQPSWFQVYEI